MIIKAGIIEDLKDIELILTFISNRKIEIRIYNIL